MKHSIRITLLSFAAVLLAGCSLLPNAEPVALERYLIEYTPAEVRPVAAGAPRLLIGIPLASGGYDSTRIAYMEQRFGLRYYTQSRWADTPANMLAGLLPDAISAGGRLQAVSAGPGQVPAELRLDTELTRFYQDFTVKPSVMHITLRVQLVDLHVQRIIGSRVFDLREPAPSDDTYGGVQAANRAIAQLLQQVAGFCVESLH